MIIFSTWETGAEKSGRSRARKFSRGGDNGGAESLRVTENYNGESRTQYPEKIEHRGTG